MKTTFKLLALVILVTFSSCNNSKKIEYKYSESPKLLDCDLPNADLLKEAVYSFEYDLINTYNLEYRNIAKSYSNFINAKTRGTLKLEDIASAHSLELAQALKKQTSLWTTTNGVVSLDKSGDLIDCIAKNIKRKDIKETYNALLTTNSLKPNLILPLLSGNTRVIQTDGSLKTYMALEFFYSQLFDVKLETLKNPNPKIKPQPAEPSVKGIDINKTPQATPVRTPVKDPHAGHNH